MLNIINNLEKEKSNIKPSNESKLNDYTYNISDDKLLKNKLFEKIRQDFMHILRENKIENNDTLINIKLNYKIPRLFNIYREIKKYIQDEKLAFYYRQDIGDIRKCEFTFISESKAKLR